MGVNDMTCYSPASVIACVASEGGEGEGLVARIFVWYPPRAAIAGIALDTDTRLPGCASLNSSGWLDCSIHN